MTLNEAWKTSYSKYLDEIEGTADTLIEDIESLSKEAEHGFEIISEYFSMIDVDDSNESLLEVLTGERSEGSDNNSSSTNNGNNTHRLDPTEITDHLVRLVGEKIMNQEITSSNAGKVEYVPNKMSAVFTDIRDLPFPKNIVFFISQLISWIKRCIMYLIEKIKNVIRALLGKPTVALNPEALKLSMRKIKKIETYVEKTPDGKVNAVRGLASDDIKEVVPLQIKALNLRERFGDRDDDVGDDVSIFRVPEKHEVEKYPVVVSIDTSKELLSIKEYTQHFYDLYDNAFGSNHEELFKSDDLAMILELFKDTVKALKSGTGTMAEIGSASIEISAIDSGRIRDNLVRTSTNIEALKGAYTETAAAIKTLVASINNKMNLLLSQYGQYDKILSSATYSQIVAILSTVSPRLKEAKKCQKELDKMYRKYNDMYKQLQKLQTLFMSYGTVSYTSVYQRRVVDLCNAAKYMTQIINLRFTGLALYIKELKDIKDILEMTAAMTKTGKK